MKNFIWKFLNKSKYQNIKYQDKKKRNLNFYKSHIEEKIIQNTEIIKNKEELNFIHSGHLGDLIYSFPVIKEISKSRKCNFFVRINKKMPVNYPNHPSGNVYLDERIVNLLLPLLRNQSFINKCGIYKEEGNDIDLDFFREILIDIRFHSVRWYMHLIGVQTDMSTPFLESDNHNSIKNNIIIVRSPRYRNDFINYNFLNIFKEKIICIGLKQEFEDLKKNIKHLEFYDCKDFLELSRIIKSCRFFIGNECFAYSVAEGLKVPRLLEASPDFPVVYPIGNKGYDFYHQIHFEKLFERLYEETNR